MAHKGGPKIGAAEVDDLLNEYLHSINTKDSQIHDLRARIQELELDLRKQDDRYQAKIREVKLAADSFGVTADTAARRHSQDKSEIARLKQERDDLRADIVTLKTALTRQEEHLKSVLKSSSKAQKKEGQSRDRLERELRELEAERQQYMDRLAVFEGQQETTQRHTLKQETELQEWKRQARRLEQELEEKDRAMKDLKRRLKDRVSRDQADSEIAQLESRHQSEVDGLEKEVARLRSELMDESARHGRKDAIASELRSRVQTLESELRNADASKLQCAQLADEARQEARGLVDKMHEQLLAESSRASALEGELATTTRRSQELEHALEGARKRSRETDAEWEAEVATVKAKLVDASHERDGSKRLQEQLEATVKSLRERIERILDDASKEQKTLRGELEHAQNMASRNAQALTHSEAQVVELRNEAVQLRNEATNEKASAQKNALDLEMQIHQLEDQVRKADELRRQTESHANERVHQCEQRHAEEAARLKRDCQREIAVAQRESSSTEEQALAARKHNRELETDITELRAALSAKSDKERQTDLRVQDQDERIVRLEMALTEKESAIHTLRRTLETTTTSLEATQGELDNIRKEAGREHGRSVAFSHDLEEMKTKLTRAEHAHEEQVSELERQVSVARERLSNSQSESHRLEQKLCQEKADRERSEAAHREECGRLRREVLEPLQEKVESLVQANQRATRELQEREAQIVSLNTVASEVNAKDLRIQSMKEEIVVLREQSAKAREADRELALERENHRHLRSDTESLRIRLSETEAALERAKADLAETRGREASLVTQFNSRTAELSAVQERNANLESLRSIADRQYQDSQKRERDLLAKLEEERNANSTLQLCFNKQQEQLENARRVREQELALRSRHLRSPSPAEVMVRTSSGINLSHISPNASPARGGSVLQ